MRWSGGSSQFVSVDIADDRSPGADRWLVGLRTADGGTGGGPGVAVTVVVVAWVGECAAVYLRPGGLVSGLAPLGNSPTAESGEGEWTIRCGESKGAPVGLGLGNRRERSIRGGRSLRLESLEPLEFSEMEAVAGLVSLPCEAISESTVLS